VLDYRRVQPLPDDEPPPYHRAAVVTAILCWPPTLFALALARRPGDADPALIVLLLLTATPVAMIATAILITIGAEWKRRDFWFLLVSLAAIVLVETYRAVQLCR
jgi:uncharacterized membrane protein YfcA